MTKLNIPNVVSLQNLIEQNVRDHIGARLIVDKPYVSQLNLGPEKEQHVLEAAQFIGQRETQARGNRFFQKDLINDGTLAEARKVVTDFVEKAQNLYDAKIREVNEKQARVDKLHNDIDDLLHSKKIKSAIEELKKATKPIRDRIDEIDGSIYLSNSYKGDTTTYFAMEAVRRLHNQE